MEDESEYETIRSGSSLAWSHWEKGHSSAFVIVVFSQQTAVGRIV